jgi:hypothetical protein
MNQAITKARQLAYLFSFLIFPKLTSNFTSVLMANERNWLWSYDPLIILGYMGIIVLFIIFWRKEQAIPNLTKELPAFIMPVILLILILFPLLVYLGYWLVFLRPLGSMLGPIISWTILALIVLFLPYLALTGETTTRQKVLAVLAALGFLICPTLGPVFGLFKLFEPITKAGGITLFQVLDIGLLCAYFICVVLLFASQSTTNATIGFTTFCAGLGLMLYGLSHPVNFGSKASTYLVTTYINGVPISTSVLMAIQANVAVIVGVIILGLLLFSLNPHRVMPTAN